MLLNIIEHTLTFKISQDLKKKCKDIIVYVYKYINSLPEFFVKDRKNWITDVCLLYVVSYLSTINQY